MNITIASRLHPFAHQIPVHALLPLSTTAVVIYPTRLSFFSFTQEKIYEVDLSLEGPIQDFTVTVDLEKGSLTVDGKSLKGFFRYSLKQMQEGICFKLEKAPHPLLCQKEGEKITLSAKSSFLIPFKEERREILPERLSLGVHKAANWDLVTSRLEMGEIFPYWLRMGSMIPPVEKAQGGAALLLDKCQDLIAKKDKVAVLSAFTELFQVAFTGLFYPHGEDLKHQGILPKKHLPFTGNPLSLLSQGACAIRSLFFQQTENTFSFLPCLPSSFAAGRMIGIDDCIQMEWSKHLLQKVVLKIKESKTIECDFPKMLRSFRLRKIKEEKGGRVELSHGKISLELSPGIYLLDRFEK